MENRNRGYITVFLTLMLSAILILVITVYTLVDLSCAKGRTATALRSAMSGYRAQYNRYLFDHYHMLFLNQNPHGEGPGGIEAEVEARLSENLGEDYTICDVAVTGVTGVLDNNALEFRKQVEAVSPYLLADRGVDSLREKVNGNDRPVTEEEMNNLDLQKDEKTDKKDGDVDPRTYTKVFQKGGVAYRVLPEDVTFSTEKVDQAKLPSQGKSGMSLMTMDASFTSLSKLKRDMSQVGGWLDSASQEAAGLVYAANCFNCLTDEVQEGTVLKLEMEYLIAGRPTDAENYKKCADQILIIRTGCNFAYIIRDASKMARLSALAWSLCWFFPPAQPVVKYLLAGAWSYLESVADLYRLVRGRKVPFMKNSQTWITDLGGFGNLEQDAAGGSDDDSGMDYEDYLLILLATRMNDGYYRMLDIMQLNVNQNVKSDSEYFDLSNAMTAFGVSVLVDYEGHEIRMEEELGF